MNEVPTILEDLNNIDQAVIDQKQTKEPGEFVENDRTKESKISLEFDEFIEETLDDNSLRKLLFKFAKKGNLLKFSKYLA